jgi:hypothetical protein
LESNSGKRRNRKDPSFSADNPRTGGVGKEFDQTVDAVECPRGSDLRIPCTAVSNGQWIMGEQIGLDPKSITELDENGFTGLQSYIGSFQMDI